MRIRSVLAAAVLALLAGCGTTTSPSAPDTPDTAAPGTTPPVGVELTVTRGVDAASGTAGEATTWTLTCDPVGGDHPTADAACDLLATAGLTLFDPIPRDSVCTEIYGGPEVALVVGTVAGEAVDARFTRTNGCEIARWDSAEALIGAPGR